MKTQGKAANGGLKYIASKVLAEKAVWQYNEEHKGALSFDLNVVMPSWVYGPIQQEVRLLVLVPAADCPYAHVSQAKSLQDVNLTVLRFVGLIRDRVPDTELGTTPDSFVDVRDVARIHVDAMARDELGGRRLLIANTHTPSYQDLCELVWMSTHCLTDAMQMTRSTASRKRSARSCRSSCLAECPAPRPESSIRSVTRR